MYKEHHEVIPNGLRIGRRNPIIINPLRESNLNYT